jgi:protein-L-isoaspartate(D-aspartate) O-methyltransferase
VLEVGTGSGYQAAVLGALGDVDVYSVEIIPALAAQAAERLEALGFSRVHLRQGDGFSGWPEHAPYNAIVVTAAPEQLPAPLLEQLAEGGRLLAPIGPAYGPQWLMKYIRRGDAVEACALVPVAFVPLTRAGNQSSVISDQ